MGLIRVTKEDLGKAMLILVPTYTMAYTTEKMVYVIPMLATMSFLVSSLNSKTLNLDEDLEDD